MFYIGFIRVWSKCTFIDYRIRGMIHNIRMTIMSYLNETRLIINWLRKNCFLLIWLEHFDVLKTLTIKYCESVSVRISFYGIDRLIKLKHL